MRECPDIGKYTLKYFRVQTIVLKAHIQHLKSSGWKADREGVRKRRGTVERSSTKDLMTEYDVKNRRGS